MVVTFEALEAAQAERAEEAAREAKGKGKRGRKRQVVSTETGTSMEGSRVRRRKRNSATQELGPEVPVATSGTCSAEVAAEVVWRAPVARMY